MLFFVAGLLFLAFGVAGLRKDRRRVRSGQRADAEVVGIRTVLRGSTGSYPVVRFRTADGREVETATGMADGDPPAARIGDRVQVIYQPGSGGDVVIDNLRGRGLVGVIAVFVIGVAGIALGIYAMGPHSGHSSTSGATFVGCFGLGVLGIAVYSLSQDRRLVRHGRRADAEVVDLERKRERPVGDRVGHWVYYAVVRFRTLEGRDVETRVSANSSTRPGDQVRIRYEINYPVHASIDTAAGRGLVGGVIAVIAGLGMLAYAIFQLAR